MKIPDFVRQVLDAYDADIKPLVEAKIYDDLRNVKDAHAEMSDDEFEGFKTEASAFFFYERRDEDSVWGTYFAPTFTGTRKDGTEVRIPDIAEFTADAVAHWEKRAEEARHPVLRARYADLVWDLKRPITPGLICSFALSPITSVFAQSLTAPVTPSSVPPTPSTSSAPVPSSAAPAPTVSPAPAPSDSSGAAAPTSPTTATAPPSTTATPLPSSPPAPMDPSSPAAPNLQPGVYNSFNQDQIKIDKNTGALNTRYPIDIPPGRNHLQPNLDLTYNSQNTKQGSIFGEGWSIGIPYIERLNKSGVDNLYSTSSLNYFTSSLDGELVSTSTVSSTASSYVARTENGTFNKYTFSSSTNQWTLIDKNGTQYTESLT